MQTRSTEKTSGPGCSAAKQAEETRPQDWEWVERSVWTARMLEALANGVKGGVWFRLIAKAWRVKTLRLTWKRVAAKRGSAGTAHHSFKDFGASLGE